MRTENEQISGIFLHLGSFLLSLPLFGSLGIMMYSKCTAKWPARVPCRKTRPTAKWLGSRKGRRKEEKEKTRSGNEKLALLLGTGDWDEDLIDYTQPQRQVMRNKSAVQSGTTVSEINGIPISIPPPCIRITTCESLG
jgi:hypothetical protein